jgi:hypothetical protein
MNHRIILIIASIAAVLVACKTAAIEGNGTVETQERNVGSFKGIEIAGSGKLTIVKGSQCGLTIRTDSNLLSLYETRVRSGTLQLGFKNGVMVKKYTRLEIEVAMSDLSSLQSSGSCEVAIDKLEGTRFTFNGSGTSTVSAQISYRSVIFELSGSSTISLSGAAEDTSINLSGSSVFSAADFDSKKASIRVSGTGTVELRVSEKLDVTVSGSGIVSYFGKPVVKQRVSGSGIVRNEGE